MKDGRWILLFEYADEKQSKLGEAVSDYPDGPWKVNGEYLTARPGNWDSYHLSPGPVITDASGQMVLFYNGSTKDVKWRIGWAQMDEDGKIASRSEDLLIAPPVTKPGDTDIAFASSAVLINDQIWLYYTTADHTTRRAIIAVNK